MADKGSVNPFENNDIDEDELVIEATSSAWDTMSRLALLMGVLLLFFVSLELMGDSFKLMGRGFAEGLLSATSNPFVALLSGILATSLVQSSSTVTALVVALVASGGLTVPGAVPIIMGANVGTTVTNTIVSMGHITRKNEFRRAMAGATVHDFFNLMAVALLFPLELFFGLISRSAEFLAGGVTGIGGADLLSPLKVIVDPITALIISLLGESAPLTLVLGLVLLFLALRYLVILLKSLVMGRTEAFLHRYIFGSPLAAMMTGVLITAMVQSSSVTTSIVVPLVGAGLLTVRQIFPFTLGANIGTTITALLAALAFAAGAPDAGMAGLTVAFAHLVFNMYGIAVIYGIKPIREIPIWMAEKMGDLASTNRLYAFLYLLALFFLLPFLLAVLA